MFFQEDTMTVETYTLTASNGRKIRKATRVIFPDGRVIAFTERMSNKRAIAQALAQASK